MVENSLFVYEGREKHWAARLGKPYSELDVQSMGLRFIERYDFADATKASIAAEMVLDHRGNEAGLKAKLRGLSQ